MRYFLLIFLFIPFINHAQSEFKLSVDNRSGYEYNVFNQAPLQYTADTANLNPIQSGFFQQVGFGSTLKKTVKSHQFSWTTKARLDHFWQLSAANLQRWEIGVGYRYQWNKRKHLRFHLKYLSYQTNRQDNGTAVINIPAAYQRWNSRLAYQWQPFKRNKSIFSMALSKRDYAATQNDQLKYWRYEGNFSTSQRFKRKGKKSSYLSWEMNFQQRDYTNSVLGNFRKIDDLEILEAEEWEYEEAIAAEEWENEEDDPNTYRRWQYFKTSVDYAFYVKPSLKLTTGISYEQRKDIWDERFGYRQFGHYFYLKWKKQQWQATWRIATTYRQFSRLFADENEAYLLLHLYLRNSFSVSYEFNESWSVTSNLNVRKRWRNQPLESKNSYLPYLTGLVSIGIRYKIRKKISS